MGVTHQRLDQHDGLIHGPLARARSGPGVTSHSSIGADVLGLAADHEHAPGPASHGFHQPQDLDRVERVRIEQCRLRPRTLSCSLISGSMT